MLVKGFVHTRKFGKLAFFIIFMVYFNILKSKVLVHWIEPTARFRRGVLEIRTQYFSFKIRNITKWRNSCMYYVRRLHSVTTILALCTIFTMLLTFLGKSCNSHMLNDSGVYYSYIVSGPNFEFKKVIRTKIPVFRVKFRVLFGYKMAKMIDLQKCQ